MNHPCQRHRKHRIDYTYNTDFIGFSTSERGVVRVVNSDSSDNP